MKRVLCLWLPNWPIQRMIVAHPELESQCLVLYARDARGGQQVVDCHPRAQRRGVSPGMSLAEVATLMQSPSAGQIAHADYRPGNRRDGAKSDRAKSRSTPRLLLREHDPRQDRQSLIELAEWCEQFSPCVGLDSHPQPAGLLLDVSHSAAHWGSEEQLLDQVARSFYERGYQLVAAIADTLGAAWAVAHYAHVHLDFDSHDHLDVDADRYPRAMRWTWPLSASQESPPQESAHHDSRWPHGFIVPNKQSATALRSLPVDSLRIDHPTVSLLQQLGVHTVEQLLQLPRSGLQSRFGAALLLRMDQALGAVAETFETCHITAPLQASLSLEHATANRQVLEQCVEQLCTQLCERLRQQQRGAIRIDGRLYLTNRTIIPLTLGLFQPCCTTRHLCELLCLQLNQQSVRDTVSRVELDVTISAGWEYHQHSLLGEMSPDVPPAMSQQLARFVDRMSCRLGADTVLGAQLMAEPQVERAFRYTPLTGQRTTVGASRSAARKRHHHGPGLRPLELIAPQRLHTAGLPSASRSNRPPATFGYQGRNYQIRRYWGPERIETGWWQGRLIRRDYYRVDDELGHRFWLFQDLVNHAWFLQGWF